MCPNNMLDPPGTLKIMFHKVDISMKHCSSWQLLTACTIDSIKIIPS